jgi:hypothetical protein
MDTVKHGRTFAHGRLLTVDGARSTLAAEQGRVLSNWRDISVGGLNDVGQRNYLRREFAGASYHTICAAAHRRATNRFPQTLHRRLRRAPFGVEARSFRVPYHPVIAVFDYITGRDEIDGLPGIHSWRPRRYVRHSVVTAFNDVEPFGFAMAALAMPSWQTVISFQCRHPARR